MHKLTIKAKIRTDGHILIIEKLTSNKLIIKLFEFENLGDKSNNKLYIFLLKICN